MKTGSRVAAGWVRVVIGLAGLAAGWTRAERAPSTEPFCAGPFEASWESLSNYQCPDWFRDAKFGIWAHWGPQCQPEQGDWYAQRMYKQGDRAYEFHVQTYGHPSVFGFKDVCHLWKADQLDAPKLVDLYKRAGAKYFVAMANHHDNFDAWNSKYQPWNSVNIGPKQDLIGAWEKAARAAGLRFGVTVHAGRAWEWYGVAHGADKDGPRAGVPYDGALTKADGKGLWWEGYDPAELYAPHGAARTKEAKKVYDDKFLNRVMDLITQHKPDLLYFDDGVLPLRASGEQYGLTIAAHLYNTSAKTHDGKNEAVMNTKGLKDPKHRQCLVWDIERGKSDRIEPFPWQTDTCIGGWHYYRSLYERKAYKNATQVVQMLVDIVSKNGNLLLNIPVRGDGSIDDEEVKVLEGVADWMAVNAECIHGTRPFAVYGEGPSMGDQEAGGHGGVKDVPSRGYSAQDFRFTTRGGVVYAIALGWPQDGKLTVRTLAKGAAHGTAAIRDVALLGAKEKMAWEQTAGGLVVTLPAAKPCHHAYVLKITPAP